MNICVYCASSDQVKDSFKQEAFLLGDYIGQQGHTLIYGGATGGLMDAVASAVKKKSGDIIGVVPRLILEKGRKSLLPNQLFEVETMNERKELLKELSDVFVVLPGGFGTLDELFDTIASGMLGYHDNKTILVNSQGYYNGILRQIEQMQAENLGYKNAQSNLLICNSATECISLLESMA